MINNAFLVVIISFLGMEACSSPGRPAPGRLQGVVELDDVRVSSEVGGRVVKRPVQRGERVTAGTLLFALEDTRARLETQRQEAELEAAQAELSLLQAGTRDLELRAQAAEIQALLAREALLSENQTREALLVDRRALPETRLEQTRASFQEVQQRRRAAQLRLRAMKDGARAQELAVASARVAALQAAVELQRDRLARYRVTSPLAAEVTDVHMEAGEVAAIGTLLVSLADVAHPFVDVFVPQAQLPRYQVGQPMWVESDGVPERLPGQVEHLFPRVEFTPRFLFSEEERPDLVLRMRVRVEDPQHALRAGMPAFVYAQVVTGEAGAGAARAGASAALAQDAVP